MIFLEHAPLQARNTFAIAAHSQFLVEVESEAELKEVLATVTARNLPVLVLGGGSNIVLSQDFQGLVICPKLKGIRCLNEQPNSVIVEAAAGENWHDFVQYCLAQGWYGLENLSLIPGTVGASPIQNIGAYGVEIKDCFDGLTAIERQTGQVREFSLADCQFAYRDSVFKQDLKDAYIITSVRFRLSKLAQVKLQYGDIAADLAQQHIATPSPKDVARAVIAIRQRKLPDPANIGNAGSFFKNPIIFQTQFQTLKHDYPTIVAYPHGEQVKLAAGWLIEQTGWKGQTLGKAGVYEKQALVLVNRGGAMGSDILTLAHKIQKDVLAKFGVGLEIEANMV